MAGKVNIPKFKDVRYKLKRHSSRRFPVLSLTGKTTIAIHHSLTKQGLGGSNAESYAKYHVNTHGWPGIGYSYVIEPDGTVKWCNDIELRTYHVGNHNNYAVGICLTGDFRYEEPTNAQKESLRNLVNALKRSYPNLRNVKGHNEFSGYEWKQCPVFDYKAVLNEKGTKVIPKSPPQTYTVQEGDTFYSIAKGLAGVSVNELLAANPNVKATELQIGQKINVTKKSSASKPTVSKPKVPKPTPNKSNLPNATYYVKSPQFNGSGVRAVQEALASVYFYPEKGAKNNGIDGYYGPKTADAVRRFQSMHGLVADGSYGPKTKAALEKAIK